MEVDLEVLAQQIESLEANVTAFEAENSLHLEVHSGHVHDDLRINFVFIQKWQLATKMADFRQNYNKNGRNLISPKSRCLIKMVKSYLVV